MRTPPSDAIPTAAKQARLILKRPEVQRSIVAYVDSEAESDSDDSASPRRLIAPPVDDVTLVFTDIQGSTSLWENHTTTMKASLRQHNAILRQLIDSYKGYEVKTEGDAFMIAFGDVVTALRFAFAVQRGLLKEHWPPDLEKHPDAKTLLDQNGNVLFAGVRVRIGINCGTPDCEPDPVTGRMDYFGPMVNLAARVESHAQGGDVLLGEAAMEVLKASEFLSECEVHDRGVKALKGIKKAEHLYSVLLSGPRVRSELPCWASRGWCVRCTGGVPYRQKTGARCLRGANRSTIFCIEIFCPVLIMSR